MALDPNGQGEIAFIAGRNITMPMFGLEETQLIETLFPSGTMRIPHKAKTLEGQDPFFRQRRMLPRCEEPVLIPLSLDPLRKRGICFQLVRHQTMAMGLAKDNEIFVSIAPLLGLISSETRIIVVGARAGR